MTSCQGSNSGAQLSAKSPEATGAGSTLPASDVRGFNYSGSWGTSGLDLWQHHDNGTMAAEISRGKRYFPGWNVARWWLSQDAFQRNPERFLANFDAGLAIFARNDIAVMPVLFNRWQDPICNFGAVPLDFIVPNFSFFCAPGDFTATDPPDRESGNVQKLFGDYLRAVIHDHATDQRVFAWDLCNEPFIGPYIEDPKSPIREAELHWLTWCHAVCKAAGARQPITIGNLPGVDGIKLTEHISDIITFHPYYDPALEDGPDPRGTKKGFEASLDKALDIATRSGKDLIASETVWGKHDDDERVSVMRYTLGELTKRNIGFLAYALHHSLIADLHAPAYGPVGKPTRLEFINADGTLRKGHEAFNEFTTRHSPELGTGSGNNPQEPPTSHSAGQGTCGER